ncbi:MAG: DUF3784 domain-containing protein [Firmicutes bacterium]|nr:DUF3784 domain-containing protein [Bacillota bacterium]
MLGLRVMLIFIGTLFIGFGYAIWFKQKYHLINNFENDKQRGKLNDAFAKRVGIIEFIGGIVCLLLGVVTMFLDEAFTVISFVTCIVGIILALIVNQVQSTKQVSKQNQ